MQKKEKTLLDYWIVLYKRKKEIILITTIAIITAIILSKLLIPVYEAKAVFYVPESSLSLSYMSNYAADKLARDKLMPALKEEYAGPYIGLLKSTKIAELVHQEFPRKKVSKLLRLDVDFELSNEFMLEIYSRDTDPELAANVANAYMKYLNLLIQEASLKNSEQDRYLLSNQLASEGKNLQEAKDEMRIFEERNNIASIDEEIKSLTNQKVSFDTQFENTKILITENDKKIRSSIEQLKKEGNIIAENEFILTNSSIEYLQKKLSDQAAQIAAASVELEEKHYDMQVLRNQYKETSDRLKREVQNLVSSQIKPNNTFYEQLRQNLVNLFVEKDKLDATKKGYINAIDTINKRLGILPAIKTEWTRLNDNVERYKKIYEQLKIDLQEIEMQQARDIQNVVVVDYAKPPENPSFPVMWLNVVVALLFGLLAGVFYAFFVDYIKETRKIRTRKIIEEILSEE